MNTIDAVLFRDLFIAGVKALEAKKEYVNELNVFPVPDGDTGTNMTMTVKSAEKEVLALTDVTMENVCKAISSGSLRGARGNSGVILSQLLRGFTRSIRDNEHIEINDIADGFVKAVETAYKAVMKPKEGTILTVAKAGAYIASYLADFDLDPVTYTETIISYMREILDKTPEMLPVLKEAGVVDSGGEGLLIVLEGVRDELKSKLPVASGVKVDLSGFDKEGYSDMLQGKDKQSKSSDKKNQEKKNQDKRSEDKKHSEKILGNISKIAKKVKGGDISTADIRFRYCTEFIILTEIEFDRSKEKELKIFLEAIGDSIVVVADDDIVKVHVHTNMPGIAIQKALTYGQLTSMKIDNMQEEHNERLKLDEEKAEPSEPEKTPEVGRADSSDDAEDEQTVGDDKNAGEDNKDNYENYGKDIEGDYTGSNEDSETFASVEEDEGFDQYDSDNLKLPRKPVGFITVSAGDGLSDIFAGLGADLVIEGGQTMNPSTEDILNAIENINADTIFILPNNSNIILASQQAASLVEDKEVIVIPSKTIPQGIMALINYMANRSVEDNEKIMTEEMKRVKSGAVTYSIRDTVIQGIDIRQGDIMGIGESKIVNVGAQVVATTVELIESLIDEGSELVSIYYGSGTTEDEANLIADNVSRKYPDIDVEVHYGGQPVYYYYLSVE